MYIVLFVMLFFMMPAASKKNWKLSSCLPRARTKYLSNSLQLHIDLLWLHEDLGQLIQNQVDRYTLWIDKTG